MGADFGPRAGVTTNRIPNLAVRRSQQLCSELPISIPAGTVGGCGCSFSTDPVATATATGSLGSLSAGDSGLGTGVCPCRNRTCDLGMFRRHALRSPLSRLVVLNWEPAL